MSSVPLVAARRRRFAVLLLGSCSRSPVSCGWRGSAARTQAPARTPRTRPTTSGTAILLELAATAVREQRLLAPAGSNAYEFYFSVLQLDPANPVATQGLQRLFPGSRGPEPVAAGQSAAAAR